MPSRLTEVPGSKGPKQSGSVMVPISVPTLASTCKTRSQQLKKERILSGLLLVFLEWLTNCFSALFSENMLNSNLFTQSINQATGIMTSLAYSSAAIGSAVSRQVMTTIA